MHLCSLTTVLHFSSQHSLTFIIGLYLLIVCLNPPTRTYVIAVWAGAWSVFCIPESLTSGIVAGRNTIWGRKGGKKGGRQGRRNLSWVVIESKLELDDWKIYLNLACPLTEGSHGLVASYPFLDQPLNGLKPVIKVSLSISLHLDEMGSWPVTMQQPQVIVLYFMPLYCNRLWAAWGLKDGPLHCCIPSS